ncbi:MAG: hypothetical protein ACNS60_13760 [Candidatus Cyclobacteriaceae bacterium M2_1C_046]
MRKLFLLMFIVVSSTAYGQVYDSISTKNVKVDLLNFADDFPTFMFSYEHKLINKFYLHHEAGIVLPVTNYNGEDVSGFKLREEIRGYLVSWGISDLFIGLDGRYTQERINDNVVLGYECDNSWWGECQFYRNEPGTYVKELLAFDVRIGMRHSVYPFFFEYDMGYGYGKDAISIPDIQLGEGYEIRSSDPFNLWYEEGWKVLPSLRFKLGYHITKKSYRKN